MGLSAAEKQRRYRERKKKEDFMGNAFSVTALLGDAEKLGCRDEMTDFLDYCYEIGGEQLTEKTAILIYGYTSLAVAIKEEHQV